MAFAGGMSMSRCILQLLFFAYLATALPLQNITLPLPIGTSNHGTPGLLCTPTQWTDVTLFYLFNYVAHAATVLTRPGERSADFTASVIGSLLFPALGLYRGVEAILSAAVFVRGNDIRKAARSGALCMVVRSREWRPADGDEVRNAVFRRKRKDDKLVVTDGSKTIVSWSVSNIPDESPTHILTYAPPWLNSKFGGPAYVHRQIIHGTYELPTGYHFAIVPADTRFTARSSPNTIMEVSATHNLVKALIALVQSGYALSTLYRSRGDQIEQFGYAAFGLTVAPYAVMSIVNLIGNLCRPDYASLYMVENSIMEEARKRGGMFEGFVGRVQEESTTVCGCGLGDGDDAEDLRFISGKDGEISAAFGVASPPELYQLPNARTHSSPGSEKPEESASVCSALTPHVHPVKPHPEKLNYSGTEDDALLLVPCCNPIQRDPNGSIVEGLPIARYRIEKLTLRKACPPFKRLHWHLSFAPSTTSSRSLQWQIAKYLITTIIALTPVAINGGMSGFQPGSIPNSESSTWKAYTMQWLILGVFLGIWLILAQEGKDASPSVKVQVGPIGRVISYVISASPAIGGYIVVGQMLHRYGVCVWVGS